jgi:hypothetical protein
MNDFGRFMSEFNKNMQQMVQTMNQMQGLYKSFAQMSPLLKDMHTFFQGLQEPAVQVSRSRKTSRPAAHRKGSRPASTKRF